MVFGYIRVSTNKQDAESQKIGIIKKSQELGLPIDEWISDEGVSGVKEYSKRNLGVLMNRVKSGDVVIVSEISRLARSVFMLFRIVEHCIQTNNCIIYAVKENQMFKKNDMISGIILSAFGTAAQIEREMLVKRVREGLEHRKQLGVILGRQVGFYTESKLAKMHDKIMECVNNGWSKNRICRFANCSKQTLYRYLQRHNITYRIIENPNCKNVLKSKNYIIGEARQKILNKHKSDIIKIIEGGITTPRQISEQMQGRGLDISIGSVRLWFAKNPSIYNIAIDSNLRLRKLHNPNNCVVIRRAI